MEQTSSEYILLKESCIHSNGIFASKNISKGTRVIEYVGDKVTKKESDKRSDLTFERNEKDENHGMVYIFELNKKYDIDGDVSWNTAKYINHSCNPNCEVEIKKGEIWVVAIKNIKEGDEISYDYGYDLDGFEDHPCCCKSKNCVGYIVSEDERPKLLKKLSNFSKKV
ncbi:SET domain-containing protein [Nanoarchaeota archaeon]